MNKKIKRLCALFLVSSFFAHFAYSQSIERKIKKISTEEYLLEDPIRNRALKEIEEQMENLKESVEDVTEKIENLDEE